MQPVCHPIRPSNPCLLQRFLQRGLQWHPGEHAQDGVIIQAPSAAQDAHLQPDDGEEEGRETWLLFCFHMSEIFRGAVDWSFPSSAFCCRCRCIMESSNGSGSDTKPQNHQLEKKRLNRAPSPARPFLKDVHTRGAKPPAIVPKSPKLSKQQQSATVPLAHLNRSSRRTPAGAKEKAATAKSNTKSAVAKKPTKVPQHAAAEPKPASIKPDCTSSPIFAKVKKGKLASGSPGPLSHGSPIRVPTGAPLGRVSQTDSSSDLSDCPSEPLSDEQRLAPAASSDAESGTGSSDRDQLGAEATASTAAAPPRTTEASAAKGSKSQAQLAPGSHGEKHKQEKPSASAQSKLPSTKQATEEDLQREIEDLRSENDYLKVWQPDFNKLQKNHCFCVCIFPHSIQSSYPIKIGPVTGHLWVLFKCPWTSTCSLIGSIITILRHFPMMHSCHPHEIPALHSSCHHSCFFNLPGIPCWFDLYQ